MQTDVPVKQLASMNLAMVLWKAAAVRKKLAKCSVQVKSWMWSGRMLRCYLHANDAALHILLR